MADAAVQRIVPPMDELDRFARRSRRLPLIRSYVQQIEAPPQAVFPLFCPVREGEWLEGWAEACDLIWSGSGVAEKGCVFRTVEPGEPETIWVIAEHDPDRGVVSFVRVTPGLAASTLHIQVDERANGTSAVSIRYVVVPTSQEGAARAEARYDRLDLLASIAWWERSMNHYLRTGVLLRRATASRTEERSDRT